jgi:hypothetical protein
MSSQLRSMLRYQFSGPAKPDPANSATKTSMSASVSQGGSAAGSGHRSSRPPPGGTTGMPPIGPCADAATSSRRNVPRGSRLSSASAIPGGWK